MSLGFSRLYRNYKHKSPTQLTITNRMKSTRIMLVEVNPP